MTFAWLPPELTAAVLTLLPVDELGRMNRVARIFSSNPSPVEQALRLRAPAAASWNTRGGVAVLVGAAPAAGQTAQRSLFRWP